MPTVTADLQRKYRYAVDININATGISHTQVPMDEFTPSAMRSEPVSSQNRKLGFFSLAARPTWSEATLRLALRSGSNSTAELIAALQIMRDSDDDTCDVTINLLDGIAIGDSLVNYKQHLSNCRVTGYKLDPLSRKADDDMVHLELTLIPSQVTGRLAGDSMPVTP